MSYQHEPHVNAFLKIEQNDTDRDAAATQRNAFTAKHYPRTAENPWAGIKGDRSNIPGEPGYIGGGGRDR